MKQPFFSKARIQSWVTAISLGVALISLGIVYIVEIRYQDSLTVIAQLETDIELSQKESRNIHKALEELTDELNEITGANARLRELTSRGGVVRRTINFSPHELSGLAAIQIGRALNGTGLSGLESAFIEMEQKYGVNALFAASVAAYESGWGRYQANAGNLFGFKNGRGGWMAFESKEDSIDYFGWLISTSYANRRTVESIGQKYCGNDSWAINVKQIMNELARKGT